MKEYNLGIIGAGASGLAAAIQANRLHSGMKIALFEHLPRAGKKILATGNGRCNLTNLNALSHDYRNKEFAFAALNKYSPEKVIEFFSSLGLMTFSDTEGRVYPRSNAAASVLDALRFGADTQNTDLITETEISRIEKQSECFVINKEYKCRKIILAGGGKSSPSQGSDGSVLKLAKALGHKLTPPVPALVPLNSEPDKVKPLKGLRASGVELTLEGECSEYKSSGEILFTDTGVSGIAAMELASSAERELRNAFDPVLHIDFLPEIDNLSGILEDIINAKEGQPLENLLTGILPKQIGLEILKRAEMFEGNAIIFSDKFSDNMIELLASEIHDFALRITGTRGFANAQVTSGGVNINEINPLTMQSKLIPGLYFSGEIIDVDGGCGGFNLQWAFASGLLAGELND